MDGLFVVREKFQEFYSEHSRIIDKVIQFVLAVVTFYMINENVGFMKTLASPVVTLALAVICTFFPPIITVLAGTALILVHMYAVSLGVLATVAIIFLIMYIFYIRLTPKHAVIVLLTPIAFALKVPLVLPIACALLMTPISSVAIICGTVVYYLMSYLKEANANFKGDSIKGIFSQASTITRHVFLDKTLWITLAAFVICILVTYTVRKLSVDHAWKIAIAVGAIANIIVMTIGDMSMGVKASYGTVVGGTLVAVVIGLVLEFIFFSVDYSRSENLQYEDDEYYYYVKAVPKLSVTKPEKMVKRINERKETEIMDAAEVRKKVKKQSQGNKRSEDRPKRRNVMDDNVDQELLKRSIKKELGE